jgi:hypothetical protein
VRICHLNFATYILWWNKPLNVSRPILIYRDSGKEWEGIKEEGGFLNNVIRTWKAFVRGLADIPNEVYHPIPATVDNLRGWNQLLLPFLLVIPSLSGITSIPDRGRVHLLPNLAMKMKVSSPYFAV